MILVFAMIALLATLALLFVVACGTGTDGKADAWTPTAFTDTASATRDYTAGL